MAPGPTDPDQARPGGLRGRVRARWDAITWTPPTSTEIGVVVKSGIAAGLSWIVAGWITGVPDPLLAPLTAIVVVQISVRASVLAAFQRSAAVVLGVLVAVGFADLLGLNALTIAVIVVVTLGFAELVLRLPTSAARQVPISALVVLAAITSSPHIAPWRRATDTLIGAAVGVVVALVMPASRLVDARQTIDRLASSTAGVLESMGAGVQHAWTADESEQWRRRARTARDRLLRQATEAVGNSKEASRWNIRDRRHVGELARLEQVLPRLERTAIGVSVISRGLDDEAHLHEDGHPPMRSMGHLLVTLAGAVRALSREVLVAPDGPAAEPPSLREAIAAVRLQRATCVAAASRRARAALEQDGAVDDDVLEVLEDEWLNYAALLVQVDRIVGDLSAPLPPR